MRKNGFDKLAFLVVLGAAVLVVLAAVGTGPAYSDDSRSDPAEIHRVTADQAPSAEIGANGSPSQTQARQTVAVRTVDSQGYEWSGSRPADQRYIWSQRPN